MGTTNKEPLGRNCPEFYISKSSCMQLSLWNRPARRFFFLMKKMFFSLLDGKLLSLKMLNMYFSLQRSCSFISSEMDWQREEPQYTSPKENSGQQLCWGVFWEDFCHIKPQTAHSWCPHPAGKGENHTSQVRSLKEVPAILQGKVYAYVVEKNHTAP